MSAPPPRPPSSPAVERRVNELLAGLVALPVVVHLAQRGWLKLEGGTGWATSKGAFALSLGPTLFGAAMLFVTRMYWAAWAAWIIDVLVLGLLSAGDVLVAHAFSPRLPLSLLGLPLLAWRIAGLQRLQRATPPASSAG